MHSTRENVNNGFSAIPSYNIISLTNWKYSSTCRWLLLTINTMHCWSALNAKSAVCCLRLVPCSTRVGHILKFFMYNQWRGGGGCYTFKTKGFVIFNINLVVIWWEWTSIGEIYWADKILPKAYCGEQLYDQVMVQTPAGPAYYPLCQSTLFLSIFILLSYQKWGAVGNWVYFINNLMG